METVTGNPKFDFVLSVLGALVPLFSAFSSFVNHWIRMQTSQGQTPHAALLGTGAVLNVVSMNIDKGVQFIKMASGKEVPHTDSSAEKDTGTSA